MAAIGSAWRNFLNAPPSKGGSPRSGPLLRPSPSMVTLRRLQGRHIRAMNKSKSEAHSLGVRMTPRVAAAIATDSTSCQLVEKFELEEGEELQVAIRAPDPASTVVEVRMQLTGGSGSPTLHWGLIHEDKNDWFLPSRRPDGTRVYKDRALQTPFAKDGQNFFLKLEIDGSPAQAVEFLVLDEPKDKWLKNNGENFRIQLPRAGNMTHNGTVNFKTSVSPPEELVQVQAYMRWERRGKQQYTPDQEKVEFEEARKELQHELDKGISLEELRRRLTYGSSQNNVPSQPEEKRNYAIGVSRFKKRDLAQIISRHVPEAMKENIASQKPKISPVLESYLQSKQEENCGDVSFKKIFKLERKELLVLVTNASGNKKVHVVTDREEPLTLHWALSKKAKEWMPPPSSILPYGSLLKENACETPFLRFSSPNMSYQVVEFEINQDDVVGMPFVLFSEGNWLKNNGCDFYADFSLGQIKAKQETGDGEGTAKDLLERIAELENDAERSLMHRFNIAADLMEMADEFGELGLVGILVWMRFMATRQLTWNKNYNVKPREISQAQDRFTSMLRNAYKNQPQHREILRMILATVGRGGEGDAGQRIRDEILVIQRNNDCKGGMMEEWHQKLHNNTSPDDVIICQALMDYIKSDFDMSVYWKTLNSNGITKERLLSYDRAIHSEPSFRHDQKEGLLRDLGQYMRTLKAVHSGADLESSIATCMGYKAEGEGFMVGVQVNPVHGLPSGYHDTLKFVMDHVEDRNVEALLEALLEARMELRPLLSSSHDRLTDLLFLDLSMDSTVRTAIERSYEDLNNAQPERLMHQISLVLENLALSSDANEDLIYCEKGWNHALEMCQRNHSEWALYAKSLLDRTRLALASKAEHYQHVLQPSAEYLGSLLGVDQWAVSIFTEEIIRAGSAASLSALLNRLDPVLRKVAHLGSWQVISPVEVAGYIAAVDDLLAVQTVTYDRPTILVARSVKGEEEIPEGTVAVLTPDMPDVLSHVSVRARNSKVCFATCFDQNILSDLQQKEGKLLRLRPTSADVIYSEISERELSSESSQSLKEDSYSPSINLARKQFQGRYAISADDFNGDLVGAKSRNISYLRGKVPSWVGIPTSVALPFGVFEKVLSNAQNKALADELRTLGTKLKEGDSSTLGEIREKVLRLEAPSQLVKELRERMKESGMPWPGDEGEDRWQKAWMAIKKVWASKWNERAYFSTRKVKLDHENLCMAVLVQEVVSADYAFVIHTTNPSSGNPSEIYAEVVKGLGETLVGAYPGRALSFTCKKSDLSSPKVVGYPSKPIGLFIRQSIIFRSDSNGEDLEGYAGAGLYDSVPMDEEEEIVLDYSSDPLILDAEFRKTILSSIARVGNAIEQLYRSPQDIEGVIKDGKLFVVQTRPQM